MPTHCFSYIFTIHSLLNPISLDLALLLHWTGSSDFFNGLHVVSRHFSIISLHILQGQRGLTTFCFLKHSPLMSSWCYLFFFRALAVVLFASPLYLTSKPVPQTGHYWHLGSGKSFLWDSCPVHWRVFSSMPGLRPLKTSSTLPHTSCDNPKSFQTLSNVPWRQNCPPRDPLI